MVVVVVVIIIVTVVVIVVELPVAKLTNVTPSTMCIEGYLDTKHGQIGVK